MAPIDYSSFSDGKQANKLQPEARWWTQKKDSLELAQSVCGVVNTLAQTDSTRQTQLQVSARLYGNISIMGVNGLSLSKAQSAQGVLRDRISYNLIQSAVDTVAAKMIKNKPKPLFLTSGGDWKQQRKAEKLSKFIDGIFYENHAYDLGSEVFRDAGVLADGLVKVFDHYGRVKFERVLCSELFVDQMEAFYGEPRQIHHVKNIDRAVLAEAFADKAGLIKDADKARADLVGAYQSIADQVTVVESWRLPSSPEAKDGRHVICIPNGVLFDEPWEKDYFPFARLPWTKRLYGYWAQSGAEQIQNIQLEINKILWVIQRSMHMAGSFKILAERGAKIVKEHFTNEFGVILEYTGTPPQWVVPPVVPAEVYAHLQTLKQLGFEQLGVSQLSAGSQKPAGLDSGRALREYQDIESERFQVLGQQYERFFLDLARLAIDVVKDIVSREGSYKVKTPGKKFLDEIDWKDIDLDDEEYVMQAFPVSSLPSDPAGRLQTITEYIQGGFMTPRAGRRLLDFPDKEANDKLSNAREDWLHEVLEAMMYDLTWYQPEPTDDLQLAKELVLDYIAYAKCRKAPDENVQMLRDFNDALTVVMTPPAPAMPPPGAGAPGAGGPQAAPMPPPTSDLIPNVPGPAAA